MCKKPGLLLGGGRLQWGDSAAKAARRRGLLWVSLIVGTLGRSLKMESFG